MSSDPAGIYVGIRLGAVKKTWIAWMAQWSIFGPNQEISTDRQKKPPDGSVVSRTFFGATSASIDTFSPGGQMKIRNQGLPISLTVSIVAS